MDTTLKRLYEAAHAGDVYSLNMLLEEDNLLLDRVVTTTAVSDNPLHIAAFLGHAAFAREILQRKPNLAREFNGQGMSPLHLAVAQGHFNVVEELLQADANLCNLRENKDGYLPVHIAAIKGRHDLVPLLIEKCENSLNELTYRSETLLHLAVKANSPETIHLLTARGVTQLMLNEKDSNGNTCLHLTFAGRQQQVIKHLLSQEGIDVNPINSAGLTPLDVLLVTNHEIGDLYLGEMIRAAGGKTAKELGISETILTGSTSIDAHGTSQASVLLTPNNPVTRTATLTKVEEINGNIENNLIVVATLVATLTFAAALNPPGGSIQMPFDENDRNNSTWLSNWEQMNLTYPAGNPVYLWELRKFFKYDYYALFTSISVILACLLGNRTSNTMLMFSRVGLWFSILFMLLAFNAAFTILIYKEKNSKNFRWFTRFTEIWFYGFTLMFSGLLGDFISSIREKVMLIAKRLTPSWMSNLFGSEVKIFIRWERIKCISSLIFEMAIGGFVGWAMSEIVHNTIS